MTQSKATRQAIIDARAQIVAAGQKPTCERVRAILGGGSYSTITQILRELGADLDTPDAPSDTPPDSLKAMGAALVAKIYDHCHVSAQEMVMAARRQADAEVADARTQLDAAEAEVRRLERAEQAVRAELRRTEAASAALRDRAARAEALIEARAAELSRAQADAHAARDAERQARAEAEQLRGMLSALAPASGATPITRALR